MTRVSYSLVFWGVLNNRISFVYYFNDFFVFFVQRKITKYYIYDIVKVFIS